MSVTSRRIFLKNLEQFIYVTRKFQVDSMEEETYLKAFKLFIQIKVKDFLFKTTKVILTQ